MLDHPGSYQRMYPDLSMTLSADIPPARPPSPALYSGTINIASTNGPNEIAIASMAAARREDQQNPLEPTSQPLSELSKKWTQADHNLLFVFYYSMPDTWKALVKLLATIDKETNVSRSTEELSKQLDVLNKAYGFKQMSYHQGKIVRDGNIVFEDMMLYLEMLKASETAQGQRARIDIALYSPTVWSSDLGSYKELYRPGQHNLPCEFPHSLSPL